VRQRIGAAMRRDGQDGVDTSLNPVVAADGSLWFWPESGGYYNVGMELIEPSHKPVALGNVFALK